MRKGSMATRAELVEAAGKRTDPFCTLIEAALCRIAKYAERCWNSP
jgi:hypothetical protein